MVSPLFGRKVYIDASALIYATEMAGQYPGLWTNLLQPLARGELTVVTSWITLVEVLVKPLQLNDVILEITYRQFFTSSAHFEILPVDQAIANQAATLRALHAFKLPDAIHIATGMAAACTHYLTGDAKWMQTGLKVVDAASL
jgi:predicted nucleic acid-binding protein